MSWNLFFPDKTRCVLENNHVIKIIFIVLILWIQGVTTLGHWHQILPQNRNANHIEIWQESYYLPICRPVVEVFGYHGSHMAKVLPQNKCKSHVILSFLFSWDSTRYSFPFQSLISAWHHNHIHLVLPYFMGDHFDILHALAFGVLFVLYIRV